MWICNQCGASNPDHAYYCTGCGQIRTVPGHGRGDKAWLWLLLELLVLAGAIVGLILFLRRDKEPDSAAAPAPIYTAAPSDGEAEIVSEPWPAAEPAPDDSPAAVPTTAPVQVTIGPSAAFVGYLDDASRLESKGLDQLCRVMEDTIAYNVRTSWGAPEHLDRSRYVGFYLLSAKTDSTWPRNILVLVYRNEVTISIPAENVNKSLVYFYTLRFENVWCNEDGSLNLPTPQKPEQKVEANIPGHYFYYMGYQTTDDVFWYLLAPYTDDYELTQRYTG